MLTIDNINKEMCPEAVDFDNRDEVASKASTFLIPLEIMIPAALSMGTCDDTDDISILSTDLIDDSQDWEELPRELQQPRSIFDSYWKQTNESPTIQRPCVQMVPPSSPRGVTEPLHLPAAPLIPLLCESNDREEENNSYERHLNQVECKERKTTQASFLASIYHGRPLSASSRRRCGNMWNLASSSNCLARNDDWKYVGWVTRKAKSDSDLMNDRHRQLRSCLRQGRYHPNSSTEMACCQLSSESHRQSVSFNPKVEVVKVETPMEIWAEDGWSSWFDYQGR